MSHQFDSARPHDFYYIDHQLLNLEMIDDQGTLLERPLLTAFIDEFSGMVVRLNLESAPQLEEPDAPQEGEPT